MSGCWIWMGTIISRGYGACTVKGKKLYVHRYVYALVRGEFDQSLSIDHLCRNTRCCNPDHLEPVPIRVNILRSPRGASAVNARKTHCPKGHLYDDGNTWVYDGVRVCRACKIAWEREKRRRARCAASA